jgi:hypothetical protein
MGIGEPETTASPTYRVRPMGRVGRKFTATTVLDLPAEYFTAARAKPPTPQQQAELDEELRKIWERVVWGHEAVFWGDEVVRRDVVVVPRPCAAWWERPGQGATPTSTVLPNPSGATINKLMGKKWIPAAFKRRRKELSCLRITQAGGKLAEESKTASDCRKPLSGGYCTNELRKLGVWKPQPRHSPKQRPPR